MNETKCTHESAKVWRWDNLPRGVAQGWNWCEDCGALLKVEKAEVVQFKDIILPKRLRKGTPVKQNQDQSQGEK